ncbi:MAG TPA: manganese efflux pump [Candidatus Binataceae bacterium]|jgi:putative Mn2+ efflux pump MntP|nr:manganese efflux pump [Candidatus Binataceae bacterium]
MTWRRLVETLFDPNLMAKTIAVALAVGLDVLAISVGVGVAQIPWKRRLRLGVVFTVAEISMQVAGYALGTGVGRMLGEFATYAALALLALVGAQMMRSSFRNEQGASFNAAGGSGLLLIALSISLDSLGVGLALPTIGIALIPLLITLTITTSLFTFIGIAFGAKLGKRYERGAARLAGLMLIALALLFLLERLLGRSPF